MASKFFGTFRGRALSVLTALAVLGGIGFAANTGASASTDFGSGKVKGALVAIDSAAPRGIYIDANGIPHCLPSGPNAAAGKSGDYANMWFSVANPSCAFGAGTTSSVPTGDSGTKIVHKTVTVNADFQAGTVDERTITFTGLPAYVSGGSKELSGSNNGGIPDGYGASIGVAPVAPTNGQTVRKFVVTPAGFNGTESYTLDVWVLVTT
jgi:hypothetical protein